MSEADTVIYSPPTRVDLHVLHELGAVRLALSDRAPRLAREAVNGWLGADHPAREIVILAASELVTNAVRHSDPAHTRDSTDPIMLELAQAPDSSGWR
jgi:anti-sigma regulatory factor (Ser/Thr protein kinase)